MLRRWITPMRALRRNVSALYVTGDKAKENYAVLMPFLEFDERLGNFQEIQENVGRRKMKTNIEELKVEHELFKTVNERKAAIEKRRIEIAQILRNSSNDGLKVQAQHLREDLKRLKENSYHLEDSFVHKYLALPNFIHSSTPDGEKRVVYNFKEEAKNSKAKSSLDSVDDLIEFYDPTCYYMKGEAAKFDLYIPMNVLDAFEADGFINFSNPDFTRSIISEAAGVDTKDLFLLKEDNIDNKLNLLHLTGNASFLNFLSYITKLSTFPTQFPMKLISTGKQYDARNHFDHQELYNVVQSTCCQTFIATADGSSFDDIIDQQVKNFIKLYEKFDQHFRIVYYPAEDLGQAESCKLGVEMFSPSLNSYIEVGNLSYFGDYISKRLLFNYKIGKDFHFPHMYSGTAVNVMKLLLVLIENNNEFKCPSWLN